MLLALAREIKVKLAAAGMSTITSPPGETSASDCLVALRIVKAWNRLTGKGAQLDIICARSRKKEAQIPGGGAPLRHSGDCRALYLDLTSDLGLYLSGLSGAGGGNPRRAIWKS
jgi:hypothetical protein